MAEREKHTFGGGDTKILKITAPTEELKFEFHPRIENLFDTVGREYVLRVTEVALTDETHTSIAFHLVETTESKTRRTAAAKYPPSPECATEGVTP